MIDPIIVWMCSVYLKPDVEVRPRRFFSVAAAVIAPAALSSADPPLLPPPLPPPPLLLPAALRALFVLGRADRGRAVLRVRGTPLRLTLTLFPLKRVGPAKSKLMRL